MEYGRRETMKSASGREPTAFTMKSIKELIADEISGQGEAPTQRTPLPKSYLQQPPHMRAAAPAPATAKPSLKGALPTKNDAGITAPPKKLPPLAAPEVEPQERAAEKPRGFLARLIGG